MVERFVNDPQYYYEYRKDLEVRLASGFRGMFNGSPFRAMLRDATLDHMQKLIKDKKLLATLTPQFEIGCRRFTPGDHYLHALQQPNVKVKTSPIVRLVERGIVTQDDDLNEVDVVICATGFDTTYKSRFPITGRKEYTLNENFGDPDLTESYLGISVARSPNFFGEYPVQFPLAELISNEQYRILNAKFSRCRISNSCIRVSK